MVYVLKKQKKCYIAITVEKIEINMLKYSWIESYFDAKSEMQAINRHSPV